MKSKILIFSATYNESKNITLLLKSIEELNLNVDMLIIDDNSPDKTWQIVQDYSKNKKNIPIKEIPFYARQRYKGKSKIERIEIFRTLINVFRLKLRNL